MKITNVFESNLYANDKDFESEEGKDNYYYGDFWIDCDYILKNGNVINAVSIDNEIMLDNDDYDALDNDDYSMIIDFYDDVKFKKRKESGDFIELSTWPENVEKSSNDMNNAKLAIKWRGGSGYHYGWWLLKK